MDIFVITGFLVLVFAGTVFLRRKVLAAHLDAADMGGKNGTKTLDRESAARLPAHRAAQLVLLQRFRQEGG